MPKTKTPISFAIVIPCYGEKANLEKLIPVLTSGYPKSPIIIVDDNSPDGTGSFIRRLSENNPLINLVIRKGKLGRGSAVVDGMKKTLAMENTDYMLEMDADFSHNPREISRLISKANPKTVVIGSRYVAGSRIINWPRIRRILSKLSNFYARLILGIPINDYTNGLRLYPREALELLTKHKPIAPGYASLSENAYYLYRRGYQFVEVPTTFLNRTRGKSNTNWKEYIKSLIAIFRIRFNTS